MTKSAQDRLDFRMFVASLATVVGVATVVEAVDLWDLPNSFNIAQVVFLGVYMAQLIFMFVVVDIKDWSFGRRMAFYVPFRLVSTTSVVVMMVGLYDYKWWGFWLLTAVLVIHVTSIVYNVYKRLLNKAKEKDNTARIIALHNAASR